MVQSAAKLDHVFHALADPTRRAMLVSLTVGRRNIGELAAPHAMSFAAASKHLRVLEKAGLVRRHVEGRSHVFNLQPQALRSVEHWISEQRALWESRFDRLSDYLSSVASLSEPPETGVQE